MFKKGLATYFVTAIFSFLILGNTVTVQAEIQEDAFVHYRFEEGSGMTILNSGIAGVQWNGTFSDDGVIWGTGYHGGGIALQQNSYVTMPEGIIADINDFTTSMWVCLDRQADWQTIYTFGNDESEYAILQSRSVPDGKNLGLGWVIKAKGKEERITVGNAAGELPVGTWCNVTYTMSGSVGKLYVNGELVAEKNDFTIKLSDMGNNGYTTKNYIGKSVWPDPGMVGKVDEMLIYDRALTEEEVRRVSASKNDKDRVSADKALLEIENADYIIRDIKLPTEGVYGSTITWSSDKSDVVDKNGRITRPAKGSPNQNVKLTAVITSGSERAEKDFTVTVIAKVNEAVTKDQNIFAQGTGNPVIPGYLADVSVYYDEATDKFYAYGTNDGNGIRNVYPTQAWYSDDLKNWQHEDVNLPKEWEGNKECFWAPSIQRNPNNGKYYLIYSVHAKTMIAVSDGPLGPWTDANLYAKDQPLVPDMDAQLFLDLDGTMYMAYSTNHLKLVKLDFDGNGKVFIDNSDSEFNLTGTAAAGQFKYKQILDYTGEFNEAAVIFEREGLYYLMWSGSGGANYHVNYAVADSVTGPYRGISGSMTTPTLQSDQQKNILGTGHHSVFEFEGRYYIAYHRQHYPFVDSKRQTAIDEIVFDVDNSIEPLSPTHKGVVIESRRVDSSKKNIALGKQTLASSARYYHPSETTNKELRYEGNFAVDENRGTHWDAGLDEENPWLAVDLGRDSRIDSIESTFEFISVTYQYKIEYLSAARANTIEQACQVSDWELYIDKTISGAAASPIEDLYHGGGSVNGRYVKITITGQKGMPNTADDRDPLNAQNALSMFEFKVFGENQGDDLGRVFEAECFHDMAGADVTINAFRGLQVANSTESGHIEYQNVNLGSGAEEMQIKAASGQTGGSIEFHMDQLNGPLLGAFEMDGTGGEMLAYTGSISPQFQGEHDVFVVLKGDVALDWFRFGEPVTDKTELFLAIRHAEQALKKQGSEKTQKELQTAYDKALELFADGDANQEQILEVSKQLINAINNMVYINGIQAKYYEMPTINVNDYTRGDAYPYHIKDGTLKKILIQKNINFTNMEGELSQHAGANDHVAVVWEGRIEVPESGNYIFTTYTDNGVQFYLDGEELINWWVYDWEKEKQTRSIYLEKGQICTFTYNFLEINGGSAAQLYWSKDGGTKQNLDDSVFRLPQIDWQKLDQLLSEAENKVAENYEATSFENLLNAKIAGELIRANEAALQHQVDEAATFLGEALEALNYIVDKRALDTQLKDAQEINKKLDLYEAAGKEAFIAALQAATTVKENKEARQTEVDSAMLALKTAINNLILKPITVPLPALKSVHKIGDIYYQVTKSHVNEGTVSVCKTESNTVKVLKIPDTVMINGYVFKVTVIDDRAFYQHPTVEKIEIGNQVTRIGTEAFTNCKALKEIIIQSKNIVTVGQNAFKGINNNAVITVPKEKCAAYQKMFREAGLAKTVIIKDSRPLPKKNSVHKVKNFYYKITKSDLRNGTVEVKKPVKKTFKNLTIPSQVTIDGIIFKVTALGKKALYKNNKLVNITIGKNVKSIGAKAFEKCIKLRKIKITSKNVKTIGKNAFKGISKKAVIYVPKGKVSKYEKMLRKKGIPKTAKVKKIP